jgi:ubiquinone/menaquinone biosynthesis C-methylase UbiE
MAAWRVGPAGFVTAVDRSKESAALTADRLSATGLRNFRVLHADMEDLQGQQFDAVLSRYVLIHQADPVAFMRTYASLTRPGGIIAPHEMDVYRGVHASPPLPILEQVQDWILAAFQAQTSHADVGTRMVGVFRAAGLPSPSIFAETIVTDGTDSVFCAWITATLQSVLPVLPVLIRDGIVSESDVAIGTLEARLRDAATKAGSQIESVPQQCAWAVKTGRARDSLTRWSR